jgi:hypothetical protein
VIVPPTVLTEEESAPHVRAHLAGQTTRCPSGDGGILDVRYFSSSHPPLSFDADCRTCGTQYTLTRSSLPPPVQMERGHGAVLVARIQRGDGPVPCPTCGASMITKKGFRGPMAFCPGCHTRG